MIWAWKMLLLIHLVADFNFYLHIHNLAYNQSSGHSG